MAEKSTAKRKVQGDNVEVILSVYWYKEKPVSVIGIKNEKTKVGHDISKSAIPADGWFGVASYVKSMPRIIDEVRSGLINNILSEFSSEVQFPVLEAVELPDYAELKHTIVKKIIEIGE